MKKAGKRKLESHIKKEKKNQKTINSSKRKDETRKSRYLKGKL